MSMVNWLVVAIGVLLGTTGLLMKRQKGNINWLYVVAGILIIGFGVWPS
ncbi:MAG: hypothetical protein LKJ69_02900 [Lactobacillus sp.]|jgi:threonine/homoserine/homoserine lactone efflux protein|nr:hypothetical protein [Lactobacillus sp.]MCI2032328.1 hypothetical protein [Lactobacillus sp.]